MMARNYRKYDEDFKQGAVALVVGSGKPIAQVARDLGGQRGHAGRLVHQGASCVRRRHRWAERERAGGAGPVAEGRTPSCGCSGMCSSVRWPSGLTRRWAGSRGRVHRRPEGTARHPVRDCVSGAVGVRGMVLEVAPRRPHAAACPSGAAEGGDPAVVREASRHLRVPAVTADRRGPPRTCAMRAGGSARTPPRT